MLPPKPQHTPLPHVQLPHHLTKMKPPTNKQPDSDNLVFNFDEEEGNRNEDETHQVYADEEEEEEEFLTDEDEDTVDNKMVNGNINGFHNGGVNGMNGHGDNSNDSHLSNDDDDDDDDDDDEDMNNGNHQNNFEITEEENLRGPFQEEKDERIIDENISPSIDHKLMAFIGNLSGLYSPF